jgi:hypothetical protein
MIRYALLFALVLAGCRSNLDESDYDTQEAFDFSVTPTNEAAVPLPGPDPFVIGEQRLSVGVFYEGDFSEVIEVNDENTHLYLYENTVGLEVVEKPLEGLNAHRLLHSGGAWWGMGVHWDTPRDLSSWATLHVSFQSTMFAEIRIGMNDADDVNFVVNASNYGYVADGEWHHLAIPLSDLATVGLDLTAVSAPLVLGGVAGETTNFAFIDNVYLDLTPAETGLQLATGPDDFQEGEQRLSIGVFYEGGSSETVEIDNQTSHVYLYENTVRITAIEEPFEGLGADRLRHTGGTWWGMGIHWDSPRDLSAWTTLHVSFRSVSFAEIEIAMTGGGEDRHVVNATTYGYVNDGEWHQLSIPLSDFVSDGLDLSAVRSPLSLGGAAGMATDFALIDNLYLSQD